MASIVEEMVFESKTSLAVRGAVEDKTGKKDRQDCGLAGLTYNNIPRFCGIERGEQWKRILV